MDNIKISNGNLLKKDVYDIIESRGGNHLSFAYKKWFARSYTNAYVKHALNSIEEDDLTPSEDGYIYISYETDTSLTIPAGVVMEWLSYIQTSNDSLLEKVAYLTFNEAHSHAMRWRASQDETEKHPERYIDPITQNGTKVLELGDGWEVFWLRTKNSRVLDNKIMKSRFHLNSYNNMASTESLFSIRRNNVAHIALHIIGLHYFAFRYGRKPVFKSQEKYVVRAVKQLSSKLMVEIPLEDKKAVCNNGWHHIYDYNGNLCRTVHIENETIHHESAPSVIYGDGTMMWSKNGLLHRADGPAVIWAGGGEEWWRNDKLHCEDGPAISWLNDKAQWWFINGKRHRLDGPAVLYADGTEYWYQNGKLHREDGSAVIYPDGTSEHWENGHKLIKKK